MYLLSGTLDMRTGVPVGVNGSDGYLFIGERMRILGATVATFGVSTGQLIDAREEYPP
jgi:hypothetical protein